MRADQITETPIVCCGVNRDRCPECGDLISCVRCGPDNPFRTCDRCGIIPVPVKPVVVGRIDFTVEGLPVPQPRPRFRCVRVKNSNQSRAIAYEDKKHPVHLWKIRVLDAWRLIIPKAGFRFEGPLIVSLAFRMPRPKNMVWKTKPMPSTWDTRQNGDVDNLAKAVLDALNAKAWLDDRQVVRLTIDKRMRAGDEKSGVDIRIEEMP